jgi:hypothetical protein
MANPRRRAFPATEAHVHKAAQPAAGDVDAAVEADTDAEKAASLKIGQTVRVKSGAAHEDGHADADMVIESIHPGPAYAVSMKGMKGVHKWYVGDELARVAKVSKSAEEPAPESGEQAEETVATKLFIPIAKANTEEQTITGVVLQPEVVDAQGDIMAAEVIRKAAHRFLAQYNKATKLGLMHKDFKPRFELVESYLAPMDFDLNGFKVKQGAWLMTVKVLDSAVWERVRRGELTGFSIGGKARVQRIGQAKAA